MVLSGRFRAGLLLLGAANLVPWMTFLALPDYFLQQYQSNMMEFVFPTVSTGALILSSAALLAVGSRLSFHARIALPTLFRTVLMLVVPTLDALVSHGVVSLDSAFTLTLVSVALNAVFSATTQNSLYALGGLIGDEATTQVQTGSAITGLVSVAMRIITKLGLPAAPAMYVFCYLGTAILLSSFFAYDILASEPSVRAKLEAQDRRRGGFSQSLNEPMLAKAEGAERGEVGRDGKGAAGGGAGSTMARPVSPTVGTVLRHTLVESSCIFTVFFVCLAIFPGLTTSLESSAWHLGSWYPILLVAAYNTGDLIGKSLPAYKRLIDRARLPCCTACHALFLPLLLLLSHPALLPVAMRSELFAMSVIFALGVATGYIGCTALVLGVERAASPDEKEIAGMVTSFCLMIGLASGSWAGLGLSRLVLS
jgi:equilibrative nucleoside transporter 1/2/3